MKKLTDIQLRKFLNLIDEEIVIANGLSYAFVGLTRNNGHIVSVYSTHLIVEQLQKEDMMELEDAEEYVQFNICDAYVGERTPLFIDFVPIDVILDESE